MMIILSPKLAFVETPKAQSLSSPQAFVSKQCPFVFVVFCDAVIWLLVCILLSCFVYFVNTCSRGEWGNGGTRSFNYTTDFNFKRAKNNSQTVAKTIWYHYTLCEAGVTNFSAKSCFLDEYSSRCSVTRLVVKPFTDQSKMCTIFSWPKGHSFVDAQEIKIFFLASRSAESVTDSLCRGCFLFSEAFLLSKNRQRCRDAFKTFFSLS